MKYITLIKEKARPRQAVLAIAGAGIIALVLGCGGSGGLGGNNGKGGGGAKKTLTATNFNIATGLVMAKATTAGVAVPFAVLNSLNPKPGHLRGAATTWTPVPGMELFESSQVSGKTLTLNFATDAAGKNKAGSVVAQSSQTLGSTYKYPVSFDVNGNITGGSVPLQAQFTLTLTDALHANTLKGALLLTNDGTNVGFDLSLDDQGNVASDGTILATYTYTNQGLPVPLLVEFTQLSGTPLTAINSKMAYVTANIPFLGEEDGTGTGSLDLVDGTVTLTISDGALKGLVESFNAGKNVLTVTAAGGFQQVIDNATTVSLASLLTTPATTTTTTTSGGSGYAAPIVVKGSGSITVSQALGDGEMVGYGMDSTYRSTGYYWASPTASPVTLSAPAGGSHTAAYGIESSGGLEQIVGSYQAKSGLLQPALWVLKSGTWQPNAITTVFPYGGVFEGISPNGKNTIVGYSYTATQTQVPFAFIGGVAYLLPTDNRFGNLRAIAVDDNNNVLGAGDGGTPAPGVWANISITGGSIKTPFKALPGLNGIGGATTAYQMSDNGVIVGGNGLNGIYWQATNGFAPNEFALGSNAGSTAYGINHAGTMATGQLYAASPSTTSDVCVWPTLSGAPVDVTKKLGATQGAIQNPAGFFLLNDGSIVALASAKSGGLQFLYIQSK